MGREWGGGSKGEHRVDHAEKENIVYLMIKTSPAILKSLQIKYQYASGFILGIRFFGKKIFHLYFRSTYQLHHLQTVQKLAVTIFKAMSFINDNTAPGDLSQLWAVRQYHLKGCDQGVKLVCSRDQVILQSQEKSLLHVPLI